MNMKEYYESSARKMVFADRHIINGKEFYFCPNCGRTLKNAIFYGPAGADRFCPKCGSFVSLAKIALEDVKANDPTFNQDMTLYEFIHTDTGKAFQEDLEIKDTLSHSEKRTLKGCLQLMNQLVDYFEEYLDFMDVKPDGDEEKFHVTISYMEIVRELFLSGTEHSGGTSTRMKMRRLGIGDEWGYDFKFDDDEEEDKDGDAV